MTHSDAKGSFNLSSIWLALGLILSCFNATWVVFHLHWNTSAYDPVAFGSVLKRWRSLIRIIGISLIICCLSSLTLWKTSVPICVVSICFDWQFGQSFKREQYCWQKTWWLAQNVCGCWCSFSGLVSYGSKQIVQEIFISERLIDNHQLKIDNFNKYIVFVYYFAT